MEIRLIQLVLLTLFYGLYFGKQLALKKQGIATNRLGRGSKPRRTTRIETLLYAATILTAVAQYTSILFSLPLSLGLPGPVRGFGCVVTALGVAFFRMATATMRDSWRAGVDSTQKTAMVTAGVYRYSRNPAFVGFDLLYIGSVLASSSGILLLFALCAILLLHLQILEEEAYLPQVFGEAYLAYRKRVPRYLLLGGRR